MKPRIMFRRGGRLWLVIVFASLLLAASLSAPREASAAGSPDWIKFDQANKGSQPADAFALNIFPLVRGAQPPRGKELGYRVRHCKSLTWDSLTWDRRTWDSLTWDNLTWDNLTWDSLSWDNLTWDSTWSAGASAGAAGTDTPGLAIV